MINEGDMTKHLKTCWEGANNIATLPLEQMLDVSKQAESIMNITGGSGAVAFSPKGKLLIMDRQLLQHFLVIKRFILKVKFDKASENKRSKHDRN